MTKQCDAPAMFRYTWPGRDESYICLEHAVKLKGVADAIGMNLQLIPLDGIQQMEHTCHQQVEEGRGVKR